MGGLGVLPQEKFLKLDCCFSAIFSCLISIYLSSVDIIAGSWLGVNRLVYMWLALNQLCGLHSHNPAIIIIKFIYQVSKKGGQLPPWPPLPTPLILFTALQRAALTSSRQLRYEQAKHVDGLQSDSWILLKCFRSRVMAGSP